MSNGKYFTLYSLRRAVAQKAYEENLEEDYQFIDAGDDDKETRIPELTTASINSHQIKKSKVISK